MSDNTHGTSQEDGLLDPLIAAVRQQAPTEEEWRNASHRLQARMCVCSQSGAAKPAFFARVAHALWSGPRVRLATVSVSALGMAAILAIALFLSVTPHASLAQAIERSMKAALEGSFHAVTYRIGAYKKPVPKSEVYSQDRRLVEYRLGRSRRDPASSAAKKIAVLFNDGEKTWQLDQKPPTVQRQVPAELLASRPGLRDLDAELKASNTKGMTEIVQAADTILDGRPVDAWEIRWHGYNDPKPFCTREFLVDKHSGRVVQVSTWDRDWTNPDPDKREELLFVEMIGIEYGAAIGDDVFAVNLPEAGAVRDLAAAGDRFAAPGIALVDTPQVKTELRNLLIGPRGELVACQIDSGGDPAAQPPYVLLTVSDSQGRRYHYALLAEHDSPGERRLWYCWFPEDLDTYLSSAARTPDWSRQSFAVQSLAPDGQNRRTAKRSTIKPQGEYSERDFSARVADVILASGSKAAYSYPDFEERVARSGVTEWAFLGARKADAVQTLRWHLRYRDLALANGHKAKFLEWTKTFYRIALTSSGKGKCADWILGPTDMVVDACEKDQPLELEDLRKAFPDLFETDSGSTK